MPAYLDLLRVFEESTQRTAREHRRMVLELPRPIEEIFPEARQQEKSSTPLREMLKKDYEHLVTAAFNIR